MLSGIRNLRNAPTHQKPTSDVRSNALLQQVVHDNGYDDDEHTPPRKEGRHKHDTRRNRRLQDSLADTTINASGGQTATRDHRGGSSEQEEEEDEEEEEEEEDSEEAEDGGVTKAGKNIASGSSKPAKHPIARKSTDAPVHGRKHPRMSSESSTRGHVKRWKDPEGLQRPSAPPFAVSDAEDEDSILHEEAQHLIAEYERRQLGEEYTTSSEGTGDEESDDVVFTVASLSADGPDVLLAFSDTEQDFPRTPFEDLFALGNDRINGGVISSLWYQDADEFASHALTAEENNSTSQSDGTASTLDIDEAADQYLVMTGLASDSDTDFEDGGETTDSLDDGDELALIRFGIEADERQMGIWQIPSFMQDANWSFEMDCEALANQPEAMIRRAARKLGVDRATATKILKGVGLMVSSEFSSERTEKASTTGGPLKMGEFRSSRNMSSNIVIDRQAPLVPSPFSVRRSSRRRATDSIVSPSTMQTRTVTKRLRKPAVDSHMPTGHLVSSSASCMTNDTAMGCNPNETFGASMELTDVLHDAMMASQSAAASVTSDNELETTGGIRTSGPSSAAANLSASAHFDDLARWNRVPIGAFRSSRLTETLVPASSRDTRRRQSFGNGKASPVLLPVRGAKVVKKSGIAQGAAAQRTKGPSGRPSKVSPSPKDKKGGAVNHGRRSGLSLKASPPRTRSHANLV